MKYSNLGEMLTSQAKVWKNKTFIYFNDEKYSYKQVDNMTNSGARVLAKMGIQKGDRVAVLMQNCPQYVIALFTIFKSGAIAIPVNNMLTDSEIAYILNDSGAKVLFTTDRFAEMSEYFMDNVKSLEQIVAYDDISYDNAINMTKLMEKEDTSTYTNDCNINDLAIFIYTSGTTGHPKGAMLSSGNMLANATSIDIFIKWKSKDKFLVFLPLFHSYTLMTSVILPVFLGCGIVLFESVMELKTKKFRSTLIFKRPRLMLGVPQVFQALAKANMPQWFIKYLYPIKLHISGGAPLAEETLNAFKQKFGRPILEGYGLSEASPVVSFNSFDLQKAGTVGIPLPGVHVKVVDDEEREVPVGEVGELIIKGGNVMKGYWNLEKETKESIRNGWLFTGDFAKIDVDNFISIVDRKKDLIISKGMNVYPREIEELLMMMDEVENCSVIGIPTDDKDEIIVAYITLAEDQTTNAKDVKTYLKKHLANYKMPKTINIIDELPMTATGKVLKRQLKEMVLKGEI